TAKNGPISLHMIKETNIDDFCADLADVKPSLERRYCLSGMPVCDEFINNKLIGGTVRRKVEGRELGARAHHLQRRNRKLASTWLDMPWNNHPYVGKRL